MPKAPKVSSGELPGFHQTTSHGFGYGDVFGREGSGWGFSSNICANPHTNFGVGYSLGYTAAWNFRDVGFGRGYGEGYGFGANWGHRGYSNKLTVPQFSFTVLK